MRANARRLKRLELHSKAKEQGGKPIGLFIPPPMSTAEWGATAKQQQADLKRGIITNG